MDISELISLISALTALIIALFAYFSWRGANKALIYQMLSTLQTDYRSPQMLTAIDTLWKFYQQHGENKFVDEYERARNKKGESILSYDNEKRIEFQQSTLHYQRRLVSHFYQHLAVLYVHKILPRDIVFKIWSEAALRIIPKILIPIENKLRQVLPTPPKEPLGESCDLMVLYRDSKDC